MIIGTFSGPPVPDGGSASANRYPTVQELLYKLVDNTANLIQAKDIRDAVYTLWERVSDVEVIASQSASASSYYTNLNPVPLTLGGVSAGSTFSEASMQQMWDNLLYPYIKPNSTLSGGNTRELGSSNAITLSWSATKKTKPITFITLKKSGGVIQNVVVTGDSQSGTFETNAVQNTNTSFTVEVTDSNPTTVSSSTSVSWLNAVYWGKTPTFSLPSMIISGTKPSWADGAGVSRSGQESAGKILSGVRNGSYNGINGSGQYLVFAWPSSYGSPSFTINGLSVSAYTKIGTSVSVINMYGYSNTYDVWISNTAQNSAIDTFVIS
jgi:hypothetical protein